MKKIIALAVLGLAVVACDPFKDEAGGTPVITNVTVTGRGYGPIEAVPSGATWAVEASTPSTAGFGRIIVVTANQLLDPTSIEQAPWDVNTGETGCDPANGWLAVTVTGPVALPAGQWYTCYYPSSPSETVGASVFIYYSATPPGTAVGAQPIRAGTMVAADFTFTGTVKAKSGADLPISVTASVGRITAEATAETTTPGGATVGVTALLENRTFAETTWTVAAVDADGEDVPEANAGTLSAATAGTVAPWPTSTVTYTPPATLTNGPYTVTIEATGRGLSSSVEIEVAAP